MGRKNVLPSYKMASAADMSADITTSATSVLNLDKASIHIAWSGTAPVGIVIVQARNGENDPWYALDMGGTIAISGASGSHQLVFNELPFTDIRLMYDRTSGSGALNATLTMKVVGA